MTNTVSGHEEIATAKTLATAHRDAIKPCVEDVGRSYKAIQAAEDIEGMLRVWGDFCLAMEQLAAEANAVYRLQREWLTYTMQDTGCTKLKTDAGTWSVKAKPGFVDIIDHKAVPEQFMTTPEPQPDKTAIKAHIKAGASVNWAKWTDGYGYTVAFTAKK